MVDTAPTSFLDWTCAELERRRVGGRPSKPHPRVLEHWTWFETMSNKLQELQPDAWLVLEEGEPTLVCTPPVESLARGLRLAKDCCIELIPGDEVHAYYATREWTHAILYVGRGKCVDFGYEHSNYGSAHLRSIVDQVTKSGNHACKVSASDMPLRVRKERVRRVLSACGDYQWSFLEFNCQHWLHLVVRDEASSHTVQVVPVVYGLGLGFLILTIIIVACLYLQHGRGNDDGPVLPSREGKSE